MIYLSKIDKNSGFPVFHGLSSAYTFGDHGCRGKPLRFHPGLVDTALDAHGAETYRLSSTGRGALPMAGSMDITMEEPWVFFQVHVKFRIFRGIAVPFNHGHFSGCEI